MFVGYHIDNCGEGVPISTGATKDAALTLAIRRVLSLGITFGEIGAKERDITEAEGKDLTDLLDKWFAEKGIQ